MSSLKERCLSDDRLVRLAAGTHLNNKKKIRTNIYCKSLEDLILSHYSLLWMLTDIQLTINSCHGSNAELRHKLNYSLGQHNITWDLLGILRKMFSLDYYHFHLYSLSFV